MADNRAAIAALEKALNAGVTQVTTDGVTVRFSSPKDMERRLDALKREDTSGNYKTKARLTRIALNHGGVL
jgi:hypothetical protein